MLMLMSRLVSMLVSVSVCEERKEQSHLFLVYDETPVSPAE